MNDPILKVCLAPIEISWGDKDANLKSLEDILNRVHPETDLLVLPETFSTGFPSDLDKEQFRLLAEKNTGETIDLIKNIALNIVWPLPGAS